MPLSAGDRLGPYEILAPIGAGGMGDVYKARDTRLNRIVAIKVSKAEFSERFEREARAVAALNHPHICQLYDVGPNYLVMEYVEGAPLKGPLPLDRALKYAVQICDALDAAHKKGITHRDLKPANILATKTGIKLLDFGLAKLGSAGMGQAAKPPDDATLTMALTGKNEIVGTLYYMSPEQLQAQATGKEIDARSDIFSFGLVLYEMLAGKRAFGGSSPASVIAAIMERPAPSVAGLAPLALDRVLRKCLAKDPDHRWQSARDLKDELEWIASAPSEITTAPPAVARRRILPWIVAAVLATVAAGLAIVAYRATRPAELKPLARLDVDLGPEVALPAPAQGNLVISPDGTRLAYVSSPAGGPPRVFTRRLDQPKAAELSGTDGAYRIFFSPDGQWVGFYAQSKLKKISAEGGAVVTVSDDPSAHAAWGDDGSIILEEVGKGLVWIPPGGGTPTLVTENSSGELTHAFPQVLPGGKAVIFVAVPLSEDLDKLRIEVVTVADRRRKLLVQGGTSPHYLPGGHLVDANKGTLFAIPFDLDKLETRGAPVPVLDQVAYRPNAPGADFDVSQTGTLVYRRVNGDSNSKMMTVQWLDGAGKKEPLLAKPGDYGLPRLSPDGKRVALLAGEEGKEDVWVYDPQRDAMTRLTFGGGSYAYTAWSPDGQYVVFGTTGNGISWTRADGAGQPQPLTQSKSFQTPWSFTPDGKRLAYFENAANDQIWTVPLEDQGGQLQAGKPEQVLKSSHSENFPAFSPDGRWLAYLSNESGKSEIYVRAFPPPSSGQGSKWQISNSGGTDPHWSRSAHDLLYRSGDQIMAASYTVKGDTFVAEKPRVWIAKLGGTQWDLAPDGKRVVVLTPVQSAEAPKPEHEVVFLENFSDELQRRVPAGK